MLPQKQRPRQITERRPLLNHSILRNRSCKSDFVALRTAFGTQRTPRPVHFIRLNTMKNLVLSLTHPSHESDCNLLQSLDVTEVRSMPKIFA